MSPDWTIILAGGAAGLAVGVVAGLWVRRRRRSSQGVLRRIAWHQLEDVTVPDDVDGEIHIDGLLLTPAGILVLEVRRVEGTVFSGEQLDNWTALRDGGRAVIRNPLPGLRARVHAVRELVPPEVPVHGRVLFLGDMQFSGDHPPEVVTLEALAKEAGVREGQPDPLLAGAWQDLKARARRVPASPKG
ncbi:MAG: nuclease-related domain-containing protein [Gammaproteobacteria bacterium]